MHTSQEAIYAPRRAFLSLYVRFSLVYPRVDTQLQSAYELDDVSLLRLGHHVITFLREFILSIIYNHEGCLSGQLSQGS